MLTFLQKAVTQQVCPRKRFLKFHWGGTGLETIKIPVREMTGEFIGYGIRCLLNDPGASILEVCDAARRLMNQMCSTRGYELKPEEDAYAVFCEQAALVEAVLRSFDREVRPNLDGFQTIGSVHPMFWKLTEDLVWTTHPEPAIKKTDDEVTALRIQVVSVLDEQQISADLHSMEAIAIAAALQAGCKVPCSQRLIYIVIGQRRRGRDGLYTQYSPFVRGYTNGMRVHWARRFENKMGKQVTLGPEWTPFPTWIPSKEAATLADWIDFLALPENDVLKTLFRTVEIGPPGEDEIEEWKSSIRIQEGLAEKIDAPCRLKDIASPAVFPMYRHSCDRAADEGLRPCSFQEICYEDPAVNPLDTLKYQRREPNLGERLWNQKQSK